MALSVNSILDAVVSHALTLGLFEQVNQHEPKNPPAAGGLTAAVWVNRLGPVPAISGLNSSSARLTLNVRIYTNIAQQPEDAIDPALTGAVDTLMGAYSGAFTLGGLVESVDLLGAYGVAMDAQAGYLEQDGTVFRVFTIVVPLIVNDLWAQAE